MARPDDDLPEIEVVGGAREARTEVEVESVPSRRARTPWIIALAVAVIVAAVGLSSRGDGTVSDEEAEPTTTSSTTEARSTTSTSRPTSTTTTTAPPGEYMTGSPAPVLGVPVNASLLMLPDDGSAPRQVNLDTGWEVELPELRRRDGWWASVPVEDGVVLQTSSGPRRFWLPAVGPGETPKRHGVELRVNGLDEFERIDGIVPSGRPDRIWVIAEPPTPDASNRFNAALIDLAGSPLATVQAFVPWMRIGSSVGLLFNAGGHAYLAGDGGVTTVGSGRVYASSDTFAAQVVCDDGFTCRQQIVDLVAGEIIADGEIPSSSAAEESFSMVQAPDGSIATSTANLYRSGQNGPSPSRLYVLHPDGRSLSIETREAWGPLVWLPGGLGLLALNETAVTHYIEEDGQLVQREVPGLLRENAASIVLIPHRPRPEEV